MRVTMEWRTLETIAQPRAGAARTCRPSRGALLRITCRSSMNGRGGRSSMYGRGGGSAPRPPNRGIGGAPPRSPLSLRASEQIWYMQQHPAAATSLPCTGHGAPPALGLSVLALESMRRERQHASSALELPRDILSARPAWQHQAKSMRQATLAYA
jgi:hypothetical protein